MPEITERQFCKDCVHEPETCGKDPEDCMVQEAADLYHDVFDQLYDHRLRKGKVT